MTKYPMIVFWSDEDGCWIADAPDLRYCSAHGGTPEEAIHELSIAMDLWLAAVQEAGEQAPEPRYRPALEAAE
jgi:predicted RNase H-like HicB family nuclease